MGFSRSAWNHLDNSIPKTPKPNASRKARINAGIRYIKKYLGGIWISGTSSSPAYKKADCSGLAMQYLMAGGIYAKGSGTPMLHASPGNEWDSQKLWATHKIKHVPFNSRRRGDLIFFRESYGSPIWHVGVMTSRNTMIDSWPPVIEYHSIFNGEHGVIAGVKRPFL